MSRLPFSASRRKPVFGVRWHDTAFPRRDMSRRFKARTCPHTPNPQRRWRGIFVEPTKIKFQPRRGGLFGPCGRPSLAGSHHDVAPTELGNFCGALLQRCQPYGLENNSCQSVKFVSKNPRSIRVSSVAKKSNANCPKRPTQTVFSSGVRPNGTNPPRAHPRPVRLQSLGR